VSCDKLSDVNKMMEQDPERNGKTGFDFLHDNTEVSKAYLEVRYDYICRIG
jgi:hypothetical protein